MKKRLTVFLLIAAVLVMAAAPASAKTFTGGDGWQVNFTAEAKMESTFTNANISDVILGMQPGDDASITLGLHNAHESMTNWYMTNEVLSSLEDSVSVAGGGAYTYRLTYTGPDGVANELFNSDTVGGDDVGEAGEGLHEATSALEDYFYLDTLSSGESGSIELYVALDGETQGNDYQDTLAELQMNFAVELTDAEPEPTETPAPGATPTPTPGRTPHYVRTSDDRNMIPYIVATTISGLLLLALAIVSLVSRKRQKKEGR